MGRKLRGRWLYAVPLLIMLSAVFTLSSQSYSQQDLRPFLSSDAVNERLVRYLDGVQFEWEGREVSVHSMGAHNLAEFILRKSAHVILYAGLGFTLLLALWILLPWRKLYSIITVIMLCLLIAFADEYNQQFSAQRTPSLADIGIDMVGMALGLCLFGLIQLLYHTYHHRDDTHRNNYYD